MHQFIKLVRMFSHSVVKKKNQLYKVYTSVKYLHRNGYMLRNKIIVRHELQVRYLELQHRQGITTCQPNVYVKIQFIQLSNLRCISARVKNLNGHLFRSSDLTNIAEINLRHVSQMGTTNNFQFFKISWVFSPSKSFLNKRLCIFNRAQPKT